MAEKIIMSKLPKEIMLKLSLEEAGELMLAAEYAVKKIKPEFISSVPKIVDDLNKRYQEVTRPEKAAPSTAAGHTAAAPKRGPR
jgi:hypothetical protein